MDIDELIQSTSEMFETVIPTLDFEDIERLEAHLKLVQDDINNRFSDLIEKSNKCL